MAPDDSGPSRSHTYRGRSRSPDHDGRGRRHDRRSSSRGERRLDAPRSRSRDRRTEYRNVDRERRRSSRDRDTTYEDKYKRDKASRKDYSPSPPRSRRRRHSSSGTSSSGSSNPEVSRERKHSKKSSRKRDSSSSRDRSPDRKHSSKSKSKRSHKSKHRSPSSDRSDEEHHRKESRADRKERKRKKREKEEKKRLKKGHSSKHKAAVHEYGKYGIITEADIFTKDQEFRAWMVEEKMLNPETVPQMKMKELFKVYMEDYNTATLPHEKYYALEKYEARMEAIRSGNVTTAVDTYDPRADEAALAAQHKRVAKADSEVYIGRAQLEQLRRIERERVEASRMKRMGMEVKESMGVRYEAN